MYGTFEYHRAQILQMICSPEKSDTAMHAEPLVNRKSSFCDGGVIFYFVAYLSGHSYLDPEVGSDIISDTCDLAGHKWHKVQECQTIKSTHLS